MPHLSCDGPLALTNKPGVDCAELGSDTSIEDFLPQRVPVSTNVYIKTFFAAQSVKPIQSRRHRGLDILRQVSALNTLSDSSEPACHPGTRTEILRDLREWATDTARVSGSVRCLRGPPGVGKSAILRTLTQWLRAAGQLGGSFTFDHKHAPRSSPSAHALFCSLAFQLAINVPQLRTRISRTVQKNPFLVGDDMAAQLRKLILNPCRSTAAVTPLVFIIDGLDKCDAKFQREFLGLLETAVHGQPCRLRILVASRSQHDIFSGPGRSFVVGNSLEDVRAYLFSILRHDANPLISSQVVDSLVAASSGCFLYASMLVRFFDVRVFRRMKRLPELSPPSFTPPRFPVDNLYTQILSSVPHYSRASLLAVLHVLTIKSFANLPLHHIAQLLDTKVARLRRIMRHLRPVLIVPDADSDGLAVHHASFSDYLVDPGRSHGFCVAGAQHDVDLAVRVLKSLAYEHENPHVNRVGAIAWTHLPAMVDYVTSVPLSSEVVSLVQAINPDFFFGALTAFEECGGKILAWLNTIHPRPAEAIALWEDYAYMSFFHATANDIEVDEEPDEMTTLERSVQHEVLLRHPQLIRLLRTSIALPALTPLYQFRFLVGETWDNLRAVICALRPVFGRDEMALAQLWKPLQDPKFANTVATWPEILRDLALQSIRLTKSVYSSADAVPAELMGFWLEWGRYVRSSPPCAELLRELRGFVPRDDARHNVATWNEVYDVLKWLEMLLDAPCDELVRWEGYLPDGTALERQHAFEARWTAWHGLMVLHASSSHRLPLLSEAARLHALTPLPLRVRDHGGTHWNWRACVVSSVGNLRARARTNLRARTTLRARTNLRARTTLRVLAHHNDWTHWRARASSALDCDDAPHYSFPLPPGAPPSPPADPLPSAVASPRPQASAANDGPSIALLEEQIRRTRQQLSDLERSALCTICQDEEATMAAVDCG
ncbi:hypothetical protein GGX14DRAFT_561956 [Mycena pura]|uniref:Nephrocystin 3-like N-terminal domain-containing protein n=1 Tax=Mycena pura TaxID=153505 RepID=A0AAD6VMD0_9AGAR|nr:hypothetical protein GGX14DRAFT_561956 [Mycena pura]